MLGARDEDAREKCLEVYKEKNRKVKRCIYQSKKEFQEQSGRNMNHDVNENRKLFWKEVNTGNGGKVENSNRIKDGNGSLVLEEEFYEDLYNIDTHERCSSHVWL